MVKKKIIIGTWPLSGDLGKVSLHDVEQVLHACVKSGFNAFDTAPNYGGGFAEASLGLVFDGEKSLEFYTKCGNVIDHGKTLDTRFLEKSLVGSLQRLRVNVLEGVYLHNPIGASRELAEALRWLENFSEKYTIKKIGISAARGQNYEALLSRLDIFQMDSNLLCLQGLQMFSEVRPEKTKLIARSPLAAGVLCKRFKHRDASDQRKAWLCGERAKFLASCVKEIELLLPPDVSAAEASLRYLLHHDQIDRIVYGIRSLGHLEQLCHWIEQGPLEKDLIRKLEQLDRANFGFASLEHLRF